MPYIYAGKNVRVRLWPQTNLLVVYDLHSGKEIARHNYDGTGKIVHVKREHMPVNHLMQLRTKQDLLCHLLGVGRHAHDLGVLITKNQPEAIARKILNGMLAVARNAGHDIAEEVAQAVLQRPAPSYEAYRREVDRQIGGDVIEVPLGNGVTMNTVRSPKHLRGPEYYAQRINKTQEK